MSAPASTATPRRRWGIALLLAAGVLVNFLDRVNLSVAAPLIQREFGMGPTGTGLLLSAFAWTYGLLQIPSGMLLDRFGVRRVMSWSILLWSVATLATSMAMGIRSLFVARMALGIAEAPVFPANAKAIGHWFPRHERSMGTAIFDAAAKFSNVVAIPLVALLLGVMGWRLTFVVTAGISLAYFFVFRRLYRDPTDDPHLSDAERRHIGVDAPAAAASGVAGEHGLLRRCIGSRDVWGLTLGFAAYGYAFAIFIFWLPGYLVSQMGMGILTSAMFSALPWAVATVVDLAIGGWLVDRLISAGHPASRVRKTVIALGMVAGLAIMGAAFTRDPAWALVWITVSLSGLAIVAPVGWSLPALVAPPGGTATVSGIMNAFYSLATIVAPIATGVLVARTGTFDLAFIVTGLVLVVGIVGYVFVLGDVEQPAPAGGKGA